MYVDALLRVSNSQAVTATAVSTDKIDLGVPPSGSLRRQIGTGEAMGFGMAVIVAADFTTGDETYAFEVVSDEDAALGSPTIHARYTRTAAQLAIGTLHFFPLPQDDGTHQYERFLGMNYVTGGTSPSITVTTWLTSHALFSVAAKAYAKGYVV